MASQDIETMDLEQMKAALVEERARREQDRKDKDEERARRERAEKLQDEERARRERAEKLQDEERARREQAENKTRRTTFPEFLDAVHVYLNLTLQVQTDKTLATKGDPNNATDKLCPKLIRPWTDFPAQQDAIWSQLDGLGHTIKTTRAFNTIPYFEQAGEMNSKKIASEKDLEFYTRCMVETQVAAAIEHFSTDPVIREKMCLNGGVEFENHANTLGSDDSEVVERMRQLNLTPINTSEKRTGSRSHALPDPGSELKNTDQICVYNVGKGQRIACFIIEYKAPHKLTLADFQAGLRPMNPMLEVVNRATIPSGDHLQEQIDYYSGLLVAAVVTQTFSYMINCGLQYGYICTGEAFVFLHIRPEEPTTVYYHLSTPNIDVGPSTGWSADSEGPNRLHLTAVGQVFAFTLRAIQERSLGPEWIAKATPQLETWRVDSRLVLEKIPETVRKGIQESAYKPSQRQQDLLSRSSPHFLRLRKPNIKSSSRCVPRNSKKNDRSDDDNDDDFNPEEGDDDETDTPTRSSARQRGSKKPTAPRKYGNNKKSGRNLVYCTQRCLRGLVKGGILDKTCPNHELHRKHGRYHSITQMTFLSLMQQQLSDNLEADCYPLYIQGSRGALFQVRLISHGYTVAAKCTIYAYVSDLLHEGSVYRQLESIQGIHIPVCIGNMDLDRVYSYDCGVKITHMMFMAWGGKRIDCQPHLRNLQLVTQQAVDAIHAIHELGILHMDAMPRNLLWNEEVQRVMVIDFERSVITAPMPTLPARRPLMPISPNPKGNLAPVGSDALMTDHKEHGQEQALDKPKFQIFTEEEGENDVREVEPEAKSFAKSFAFEVESLRADLSGLVGSLKVVVR